MTTVILCGGAGTRLWPLSRAAVPKQFARILPGKTLFESAVERNMPSRLIIASSEGQAALAAAQLKGMGVGDYSQVIEPIGRNTAPAIALAALAVPADEILLVVPSDHLIAGVAEYQVAVLRADTLARSGRLVTFGISPEYPETGYGYIEADGEAVLSFKEKPDAATAERYVKSGRYLWNSGMFCFAAGAYLKELERHSPDVYSASLAAFERASSRKPLAPDISDMSAIPSISVDYAVMEKSDKVACVRCPASMGWSDLGSYDSLYGELRKAGDTAKLSGMDNYCLGSGKATFSEATGNLAFTSARRVVISGVDDLIVVDTDDALLIAKRGNSQSVKQAVDALKSIEPGLL